MMTPRDFLAMIVPQAQLSQIATGISAGAMIAQAALESGWGVSQLSLTANNLFGIKATATWHGATVQMTTREFLQGDWVEIPATWRVYKSWADSITDHAQFLFKNPRYKPAIAVRDNAEAFCEQLQACGYATDPQYADLLISIVRGRDLTQYDVPQDQWELLPWAKS